MTCVCGYEFEHKYKQRENSKGYDEVIVKGEKNFIRIEGNFTIKGDFNIRNVSLFACPVCLTIKMID